MALVRRLPHDDRGDFCAPSALRRRLGGWSISAIVLLSGLGASSLYLRAQSLSPLLTSLPGAASDGTVMLPNGWRVAPVGRLLPLATLPLNIVLSPDGKYAVVANNGLSKPTFSIIDVANWTVKNTT